MAVKAGFVTHTPTLWALALAASHGAGTMANLFCAGSSPFAICRYDIRPRNGIAHKYYLLVKELHSKVKTENVLFYILQLCIF